MGKWLRKLIGYSIIAISLAAGWTWIKFDFYQDAPLFEGDESFYYTVKPGSSVKNIAKELVVEGV